MKRMMAGILGLVLTGWMAAETRGADDVWWEGEAPVRTNFPAKTWMSGESLAKRAELSGGQWLTADGKRGKEELFARYSVEVPADGTYGLWCRKFWQHGAFTWKFDGGASETCGRDVALADSVELQKFVSANWVYLGKVKLSKGKHAFEIRLLAKEGESTTAAFDCFVLTPGAFLPNGKLKPGERSGLAEEGTFAWEPGLDGFTKDALLDLRSLNEAAAGEKGFVGKKGHEFVLGDGKPVRFFAVNVSVGNAGGARESVDYLAAALAKRGVNMVRFHGPIYDFAKGPTGISEKKLDDLQYLVAAMKKQGIYTTLSFYFPLWVDAEKDLRFAAYGGQKGKNPFALLLFDPKFQEIHRAWAKTILTTKSPYTGLPLAEDPAVAMVEVQNEDSFFFWTFAKGSVPAAEWAALEKKFGGWLAARYGSVDKALLAWGGGTKNDDAAGGRVEIFPAWNMTGDGAGKSPGGVKRVGDQVRFLAEMQRAFYGDTAGYFKKELKLGGLVVASNWTTTDPHTLDAIERYTYTAADVMDRHGYFGGKHEGAGAGYSVTAGQTYEDASALLKPAGMPFQVHAVDGLPHIITELGFTQPNRFRAEATLLSAAYSGLQGTGGIYFFAVGSNFLRDAGIGKFQVCDPVIAGTFPAAALVYRRGDVSEGPDVLREVILPEQMFSLKGTAPAAAQALDELRLRDGPAGSAAATFDPLLFYTGRVTRGFAPYGTGGVADGSKGIDHGKKVVHSVTGQLDWDYGNGVFTINTPRTQAAAGFLSKSAEISLGDVAIESGNEYASVAVTALDDLPIKTSRKILIQVMTEEKPYGFKAAGGKIVDVGSGPFDVRKIDTRVVFKMGGNFAGKALDENGYPRTTAVGIQGQGDRRTVTVPADAVYVVLTR